LHLQIEKIEMKLRCLSLIFGLAVSTTAVQAIHVALADTNDVENVEGGLFSSATNRARLVAAKHEFNVSNMRGALTLYREILASEPENSTALYWTARCHYHLKRYDLAKEYLERAVALNPNVQGDINLFFGKIYHRLAELDLAIEAYDRFLELNEGKQSFEVEEATRFVSECRYAKEMMQHPVPVVIRNMGPDVNSRFDEYAPSVTADGKKLLFTSRRSDATGGEIDEGGDYKFYEDIYVTEYDISEEEWTTAGGVSGAVNSPQYDAVLSVAPSGDEMFVYRNNANSAGDIFVSKYLGSNDEWMAPEKMPRPVNSSYFESSCSITADGKFFYFISERPEGLGQGDIYVSEKGSNGSWSKPKNLGKVVNTELDEKFVFIHPNGKTLFFASDGHQTMGSYDIFRSEFVNGQWSIPVNLGYPINTVNEESTFSLRGDNQRLYIAAEYVDALGERDLYEVDITAYKLLSEGYDKSSYGTVIFTVEDASQKRVKGADVVILLDTGSDREIARAKTDKLGRVRINLPGGVTYRIQVTSGRQAEESKLAVTMNEQGETVINHTVILK
jgi:tetratricopeptide (TPR) repeat protein